MACFYISKFQHTQFTRKHYFVKTARCAVACKKRKDNCADYSHSSVSSGDWFQDLTWIQNPWTLQSCGQPSIPADAEAMDNESKLYNPFVLLDKFFFYLPSIPSVVWVLFNWFFLIEGPAGDKMVGGKRERNIYIFDISFLSLVSKDEFLYQRSQLISDSPYLQLEISLRL